MAESWADRLSAVGQNLLTLEINTIATTSGLSAQKMPEVPLALHTLVQVYGDYLAAVGFQLTQSLVSASADRLGNFDRARTEEGARALLRELQSWPFANRRFTAAEEAAGLDNVPRTVDTSPAPALDPTNGAETFEALQWAAWAALQTLRAGFDLSGSPDPSVLSRINANCRQLKETALRLEQQHEPRRGLAFFRSPKQQRSNERLGLIARSYKQEEVVVAPIPNPNNEDAAVKSRLFGATIEQTASALFQHPRPVFTVDPDITILIRKAWDLGVKRVRLQTVLQVDGDVTQVIGDLGQDERDFLVMLHKSAVKESVAQWRAFFDLIRALAGDLGRVVFGG